MVRFFSFLLLLLALQPAKAQTDAFKKQLCKAWSFQYFVINGQKMELDPDQKNDRMIFLANNTVKTIDHNGTEMAKWSYNAATKALILIDDASKEKMVFTVTKLDDNSCVLSAQDGTDKIVMHLAPVKAK